MKFSVSREALSPAVQLAAHLATSRAAHPLFSHLLLRVDGSSLTVSGYDGESMMQATFDVDQAQAGEAMLPAEQLQNICQKAPAGESLSFESDGEKIRIQAPRLLFNLTPPQGEFPLPTAIDAEQKQFDLPAKDLHLLLKKALCCVATTDFRHYLTGALLHQTEDGLVVVATDSHRLFWSRFEVSLDEGTLGKAIIPRRSIDQLLRMMELAMAKNEDTRIHLTIAERSVLFSVGRMQFQTNLITGNYPDYEKALPDESDGKALFIDTEKLVLALDRMAIISERDGAVKLDIEQKNIRLSTHDSATDNSAEEHLEAKFSGSPVSLSFNISYLREILANIDSEQVQILLGSNTSVDIRKPASEDQRYVLMPLRV